MMSKSIFNKGAFKIKVKTVDEIKRLDGGYDFTIVVKHYESGEPIEQRFEFMRDCIGYITVDPRV